MNKKETTVIANGKEIDVNNYLTTMVKIPETTNFKAQIEIISYTELGCIISSVLSVTRSALENEATFCDNLEIARTLELVQQLIPFSELELLDKFA